MAKYTILKNGIFRRSNRDTPFGGELVLEQWLKTTAVKFGIPFDDACCDNETIFPVGLDASGNLQNFDPEEGTWSDINVAASVDPAITALGVDDTDGYALTKSLSVITGGAANTGVELPAAAPGLEFTVVNLTATAKKVYATTGDTIDDKTATTGFVILQPEDVVTFRAYTTALWQSDFESEAAYSSMSTDTISEFTAATGVTVDGALIKDGGISANSMFAGFYPTTAAQALTGAGAINVTAFLTKFTSSGAAQALTLASGTQIGQRKKVSHVADGGSGVLTAAFVGGTTITFTTVGEFADLIWNGSAWGVLELGNSATPGTPPVLA